MNFEQIKKDLENYLTSDKAKQDILEYRQRHEQTKKNCISKFFPDHKDHTQEEGDWEYFDAMFVSFNLICSCGETLKITREMTEDS